MEFTRRNLMQLVGAAGLAQAFGIPNVSANDLPDSLKNARDQLYNYLLTWAQGTGMSGSQRLVLNSLIFPFDIADDTPYHNEEIFRQYCDQTFHGGVEGIKGITPASQSERFSSQYRSLINLAASRIDQNHPEIASDLRSLRRKQSRANKALADKFDELDSQWEKIAKKRGIRIGSQEYDLQRITWQSQVRYADQVSSLSKDIDNINSEIDAVRRKVYTPAEASVIDNLALLGSAYNVARPWNAQTERSQKEVGEPLSDISLADVNKLSPAIFDSSPIIFPVGDLRTFLSASNGAFGFDTGTQSYALEQGTHHWVESGSGSFLGWSVGGGGSGSSSYSNSMSTLNSITLSFTNIAEYIADRSAWFNPAVLRDKDVLKLVSTRDEINRLQYIAVSLLLVRGTSLELKFSQSVNSSDFSQASWNAHGGGSFLGFGFGVSGGASSSRYTINNNSDWTTVTFQDDPNVCRVVGVRVEPFLANSQFDNAKAIENATVNDLAKHDKALQDVLNKFESGKASYLDLQRAKLDALIRARNLGSE